MPTKTFRLSSALAGTSQQEITESAVTTAVTSPNAGWTLGKIAAGNYAYFDAQTEVTTASLNTNPKPGSNLFVSAGAGNAFRSTNAYSGDFAAGNWVFTFALRSVSTAATGSVRIRFRVFKSSDPAGNSPTDISGTDQIASSTGALSTSVTVNSSLTVSMPAVQLRGQYLFIAVALEIVTASGSNTADAIFMAGATTIATTNFSYVIETADSAPAVDSTFAHQPVIARFTGNNLDELTATQVFDKAWGAWGMGESAPGGSHTGEETAAMSEATSNSRGALWYNSAGGSNSWAQAISSTYLHESPRTGHFFQSGSTVTDYNNMGGAKFPLGSDKFIGAQQNWSIEALVQLPVTSPGSSARRFPIISDGKGAQIIDYQCNTAAFFNQQAFGFFTPGGFSYDATSDVTPADSMTTWFFIHLVFDFPTLKFYINGVKKFEDSSMTQGPYAATTLPTDLYSGFHRNMQPYGSPGVAGEVQQGRIARLGFYGYALKDLDIWRHNQARLVGQGAGDFVKTTDVESHSTASTKIANGADTAAATDGVTRQVVNSRSTSDSAPSVDTSSRTSGIFSRGTPDTAGATDALTRSTVFARGPTDTAGATDASGTSLSRGRNTADTAAAVGSVTRSTIAARGVSDNAPAISSLASSTVRPRSTSDTASAVDTSTRQTTQARQVADSAPASEVVTRSAGIFARLDSDSAPAVDSVARQTVQARSIADSAPAVGVTTRQIVNSRGTSDSAPAVSSVLAEKGAVAFITDNAPAVDTVSATGRIFITISDSAPASSAVQVAHASSIFSADNASAVDTLAKQVTRGRQVTDNAPASDSSTRTVINGRSLSDAAGAVDTLSRSVNQMRSITDVAGAVDSSTRQSIVTRVVTDQAVASDSASRQVVVVRQANDTASASDISARHSTHTRGVSDLASAIDTLSTHSQVVRGTFDIASSTDSVARLTTQTRIIFDTADADDSTNFQSNVTRVTNDSASTIDEITYDFSILRSLEEDALAVDVLTRSWVGSRTIQDTVVTAESETHLAHHLVYVSDSGLATDNVSITQRVGRRHAGYIRPHGNPGKRSAGPGFVTSPAGKFFFE